MPGLSQRIAHERLIGICFIDYDREMALVAEVHNPHNGQDEIIGVARLIKTHGEREAEFAVLITDRFLGKALRQMCSVRWQELKNDQRLEHAIEFFLYDLKGGIWRMAYQTSLPALIHRIDYQIGGAVTCFSLKQMQGNRALAYVILTIYIERYIVEIGTHLSPQMVLLFSNR